MFAQLRSGHLVVLRVFGSLEVAVIFWNETVLRSKGMLPKNSLTAILDLFWTEGIPDMFATVRARRFWHIWLDYSNP